jgi:FtsH-binding integral membrane protein
MTEPDAMTEREVDQQFWQRCCAALGMMWGLIPLITLPFASGGPTDTPLDMWAAILNGFTLLPASVLVLWHRRLACIWMTLNAVLIVSALTAFTLRNHTYEVGIIIGAAVSVLLAIFFDIAELKRWPQPINRARTEIPS